MLEQRFLDMLCCPACRGNLQPVGDREELRCPACAFDFPIVDGIPVLFPCNVKQEFDSLFDRHWDSEQKARYYDESIEGVGDPDPFAKYQHESELLGIEQCYDASKLGSLLDAGCGNGRFLATLPAATLKVGVDASLNLLRATRRRGRGDLLVCCELEHLPFKADLFDTVISCRVLQHIVDQESAVSELCRTVRPSGDVILEVYNTWNPKTVYKAIRMSRLAPILNAPFQWIHPKLSPFAPWGLAYDRYNSWAELRRWLRRRGMRVVDARGVGFGVNKYLVGPFLIHALVRRISPTLLRAYYALCLRLEPIVGRLTPFKYGMEKLVVKATK